ncbi:hypothetical protein CU102_12525 [Phyllobacterium brassicacearum]|uniref:Uncharacterized protein n=1 Tax=Phyllobacterium brassicacearum TaxID=314235 RepID=A0A2P7BQ31_9HYPH|nr:hypothetical protein [Phyllobacterium brassicacearum]PSH68583.1 hypothetical protein CU102_12525 [Phyllobacterium brassicacearum]TDQ24130.1 hypothetical protein DEV91_1158 [Phyllobacterium brassicacearum]
MIDLINHNVGMVICMSAIVVVLMLFLVVGAVTALRNELAYRTYLIVGRLDTALEDHGRYYSDIWQYLDTISSELSELNSDGD